jgi:hypothetical protein
MVTKCFGAIALICCIAGSTSAAAEIRGIVTRIDPAKNEVVIEGRGKGVRGLPVAFALAGDTEIVVDRKPGTLADLRPGARVRILYDMSDGRRVALAITAHGGTKPDASVAMPADENTVVGKLIRVALTDREIVILSPGQREEVETTLAVPESAEIKKDQKAIKLEDLKEGERVVVRTDKRDGKRIATSIQVGGVAPTRDRRIERLRQLLKLAEELLEKAEREHNSKP